MKNTNIVLLSFLVAVLTISFIQYSDAASADDPNVLQFCDRTVAFYNADNDAFIKKYANHHLVPLCDYYDSSKYSKASSNDNAEAKVTKYPKSSSYERIGTNYWAEAIRSSASSNDNTKVVTNDHPTNYWADKFTSKSQVLIPAPSDYKAINDYKPNTPSNNWKDQYPSQHPVNNPANSIRNHPTFDWGMFTNPFFR